MEEKKEAPEPEPTEEENNPAEEKPEAKDMRPSDMSNAAMDVIEEDDEDHHSNED